LDRVISDGRVRSVEAVGVEGLCSMFVLVLFFCFLVVGGGGGGLSFFFF